MQACFSDVSSRACFLLERLDVVLMQIVPVPVAILCVCIRGLGILFVHSWGSYVSEAFFKDLVEFGGKVKFFKKFRYSINLFSANHERNHRKLLVIDDKIIYDGYVS